MIDEIILNLMKLYETSVDEVSPKQVTNFCAT